jgi:hypothetical protein
MNPALIDDVVICPCSEGCPSRGHAELRGQDRLSTCPSAAAASLAPWTVFPIAAIASPASWTPGSSLALPRSVSDQRKMTGAADFHAQADALFRKNLAIQVATLRSHTDRSTYLLVPPPFPFPVEFPMDPLPNTCPPTICRSARTRRTVASCCSR